MTKTIRELAKELQVSKQTIQYHYQRLSPKDQQKDNTGKNIINEHTEKIIRDKVTKTLSPNEHIKSDKENKQRQNNEQAMIVALKAQINDLKNERDKQFATKEKQIASKDRQIDNLTKLLDQSQQLQLIAEKKIQELQKIEQPKTENSETEHNKSTIQENTKTSSKKWWHFWH